MLFKRDTIRGAGDEVGESGLLHCNRSLLSAGERGTSVIVRLDDTRNAQRNMLASVLGTAS